MNAFLIKFTALLEEELPNQEDDSSAISNVVPLIKELNTIGFANVISFDNQTVSLQVIDQVSRKHQMDVTLPEDYHIDNQVAIKRIRLPGDINIPDAKLNSVCSAYDEFCFLVDNLQGYWTELEELDREAWIVEPEDFHFGVNKITIVVGMLIKESLRLRITTNSSASFFIQNLVFASSSSWKRTIHEHCLKSNS